MMRMMICLRRIVLYVLDPRSEDQKFVDPDAAEDVSNTRFVEDTGFGVQSSRKCIQQAELISNALDCWQLLAQRRRFTFN